MKNLVIKTTAITIFASIGFLAGQNKIPSNVQFKAKMEIAKKKVYTFRTMKEKEMRARAAYTKLSYNLKDTSYPRDILELEKREMICLIKGKIIDDRDF